MLQPKKTKYRKQFRGRMRGQSQGHVLAFGDFGLKALESSWLTANQIEAARRAITHYLKRNGRVWIRIFPDKPITQKGAGAPLGAGKGDVKGYVAVVKAGRIIFELAGVAAKDARAALILAAAKLPLNTTVILK